MRLRVGARTDIGRVRELNEDVYVCMAEQGLFVVCDGMGGCPSGEVASQMAADAILDRLAGAGVPTQPSGTRGFLPRTSLLAEAVRGSNSRVYDHAQSDARHAEMGTTVVSAWIDEHIASVAHVGDSRAYLWHDDQLEPLTRDHSFQQSFLLRVLGREPHVEVDLNEVPVRLGEYLVLCSDGLTRMVPDQALARAIGTLRHPQRICDYLIDTANRNGGADNITLVVIQVVGNWWWRLSRGWRRRTGGTHHAEARSAI
jgi:serine/threonine protein phosphatase PrpC